MTISKREMKFRNKYGDVAGAIIFRLLMLNMRNGRWPRKYVVTHNTDN